MNCAKTIRLLSLDWDIQTVPARFVNLKEATTGKTKLNCERSMVAFYFSITYNEFFLDELPHLHLYEIRDYEKYWQCLPRIWMENWHRPCPLHAPFIKRWKAMNIRSPFLGSQRKMAHRSCAKFLKSAMRGCQDDVNFTLKPLFTGKHFRKPVNKGFRKWTLSSKHLKVCCFCLDNGEYLKY